MEIDIDNLKQYPNLLEHLEYNLGYFNIEFLNDMILAFSENYSVVIKDSNGEKQYIKLIDLKDLENTEPYFYESIKEVFIPASDYNYLFDTIKIRK